MPAPVEFLQYVEDNANVFIDRLRTAVSYHSVSSDLKRREDVKEMGEWLETKLHEVGVTNTKLVDLGYQTKDGKKLDVKLPPVVLGRIGEDPKKTTVLVYGHYDVQPADKKDGWTTEDPFKLEVLADGRMVGRGSTDDKGPVLGWINVLQYHHEKNKVLPVNLRFCFEGMEESGSEGLDALIINESKPGGWFYGTNCVCISDNYWLNKDQPALTYGVRGLSYFYVTITGPKKDLHSGIFGRTVHEPMTDLFALFSKLVSTDGTILIPGIEQMVPSPTPQERALYERLHYSMKDLEESVGASIAIVENTADTLMHRMRYPSLSIHGIQGAFSDDGPKSVIPGQIVGKFSIRLVPPMTAKKVEAQVELFLQTEFAKLKSKNTIKIDHMEGANPWLANYDHWNFRAAKIATQAVYKKDPDFTREGGSIPVTLTFQDALNVNVLLLPMGRGDDGAHAQNEKLDRGNFINGTKLLGSYLYEVATIDKKQRAQCK